MADRAIALEGALESLTLLKNEGHLLRLTRPRLKKIAIIGPNAYPAVTGGGGSSEAHAFEPVSTLTGIANLLGPGAHVLYNSGLPEMNDVFRNTHWEGGVKMEVYPNGEFTGTPETTTLSNLGEFQRERRGPGTRVPHSIRYTASYQGRQDWQVP